MDNVATNGKVSLKRFQLRIKLVASEFASASSFFLQSAFASTKILPLPLPHSCFKSRLLL